MKDNKFLQTIVLWLMGVCQVVFMAVMVNVFDRLDENAKATADHKMYATETYARRDDVDRILHAIEKLSDKVDTIGR